MNYEVETHTFDAARPYAVVATFRSFNRVIGRYEDKAAADLRASAMNLSSKIVIDQRKKMQRDIENAVKKLVNDNSPEATAYLAALHAYVADLVPTVKKI